MKRFLCRKGGTMFFFRKKTYTGIKQSFQLYKKSGLYFISIIFLFLFISIFTTIKPAYRFSFDLITEWTNNIDSSTFLYLLGMENRAYKNAYPKDKSLPNISNILLQMSTNIKLNDPRSLIGQELPGFSSFGNQIIIAGEGTNYTNLSIESSPPLEEILEEREAVFEEIEEEIDQDSGNNQLSTGDKNVVFIYNTHNRESFLPHLPSVTDPKLAYHDEVNITKVSEYLSKSLEEKGIGTEVDFTDHMSISKKFSQLYKASRTIVEEALASNNDIQYIFDLHRDSLPRDKTTKVIQDESYAKILMVVGAEYDSFEKNLKIATKLHELIDEKYPGLSRGVITKEGPGSNGVYNQDLSENALLIEFGGYDNTLEELYRTAEAVAEVFSDYYWDAEKVDAHQ